MILLMNLAFVLLSEFLW